MWPRFINTMLGIWMMIAPSVFSYDKTASDNAYIFGAIIATVAIIAIAEAMRSTRWLNLIFGIWLILAPWVLSFDNNAAKINDTIVGILVASMSLIKGRINEQLGGGWTAIFRNGSTSGISNVLILLFFL